MKKIYTLVLFFITFFNGFTQIVNIPDVNFKNKLIEADETNNTAKDLMGNYFKIDIDNDGEIQIIEALQISYLDVSNSNILSLDGLESFTNLNYLFVNNNSISNLFLNSSILTVDASFNNIQDLTVQFNSTITSIDISNNLLTNLDIYSCIALSNLVYNDNLLLNSLMISNTNLLNLTIENFPNLTSITCLYNENAGGTKLNSITTVNLPQVNNIDCNNNHLTNLDLSGVPNLANLNCKFNNLTSLNLNGLSSLFQLDCSNNNISSLSTSGLLNLYEIFCSSNQINFLDLSNLTNLRNVDCSNNLISSILVNNSINMLSLICFNNQLVNIDLSGLSNLNIINCSFNNINLINTNGLSSLQTFKCNNNQLTALNVSALNSLKFLTCNNNQLSSINVNGLINLLDFYCSFNLLQSLDIGGVPNLYLLDFSNNNISTIDVSSNLNLRTLYCSYNQLSNIDLEGLNNLIYFKCNYNNLTSLMISNLSNLGLIHCNHNQLTSLSLVNLSSINYLDCSYNLLESITLDNLLNFFTLNCDNNLFTTLDLNNVNRLYGLSCNNNQLTSLLIKIKNGSFEYAAGGINFSGNPNLQYICADEFLFSILQNKILQYGYSNCTLGSYCTFFPAGTYYLVEGNNRYDANLDGCDSDDILVPNMKFSITNGSVIGNFIGSTSGSYSFPVLAGTNVIVPKFENPTYYNANPQSITLSFPTSSSPFIQDFCITKNGIHDDLEIVIIPLTSAVPGFDVLYKIVYKNNGVTFQNGSINLIFNNDILDFISANPLFSSQVDNSITWTYSNLLPFETREIILILNLNSPMETPSVNSGDILTYTATIASANTDENIDDNNSVLHQTVVNSYDPNDKTCLEGETITPSMVGKYVHYMIRFENTGTFPAQNIVVKDMIDATKYDVSTLIPLHSSHEYITRINGNKVEFIFENINLPFDDANNDGYLVFKIKTKPTLVLGDTFTNNASIYFDYNFPIITNTTATTVTALSTQDFEFNTYFTIYPNPAKQTLNINTKNEIGVKSVAIYNTLGQVVLAYTNAETLSSLDVSQLKTGAYFIKLTTDKGTASQQFLKE